MVKEIESTVYVTSNGEKFVDKEKADNREKILKAHNNLNEYRIKDNLLLYNVFLANNIYREIYKIPNKKDFDVFINSLKTFYNEYGQIPEDDTYTKIIHSDYDTSCDFYVYLYVKNYDFDGYNYRDAVVVYSLDELSNKFMKNVHNIEKIKNKLKPCTSGDRISI